MTCSSASACLAALGLALTPLSTARADVLVVDAAGGAAFTQIQDAVDAAQDGDVVLVRYGTYARVTITGKGVQVARHPTSARPRVVGGILVSDTLVSHTVVLAGLDVVGDAYVNGHGVALRLDTARGPVRVEDCSLLGHLYQLPSKVGHPACQAVEALDLSLVRSTLQGGPGKDDTDDGHGGSALELGRGCNVAVHDCHLSGGRGGSDSIGHSFYYAGIGGDALRLDAEAGAPSRVIVAGSELVGGKGGDGGDNFPQWPPPGSGGNGLHLLGHGSAWVLDSTLLGGAAGVSGFGVPGLPEVICPTTCTATDLAGSARELVGTTPAYAGGQAPLSIRGLPGDQAYLLVSDGAAFDLMLPTMPWSGPVLVAFPLLKRASLGVVPSSGVLGVPLTLPGLGGLESRTYFLQLIARDAGGALWAGGPSTLVAVDPAF